MSSNARAIAIRGDRRLMMPRALRLTIAPVTAMQSIIGRVAQIEECQEKCAFHGISRIGRARTGQINKSTGKIPFMSPISISDLCYLTSIIFPAYKVQGDDRTMCAF